MSSNVRRIVREFWTFSGVLPARKPHRYPYILSHQRFTFASSELKKQLCLLMLQSESVCSMRRMRRMSDSLTSSSSSSCSSDASPCTHAAATPHSHHPYAALVHPPHLPHAAAVRRPHLKVPSCSTQTFFKTLTHAVSLTSLETCCVTSGFLSPANTHLQYWHYQFDPSATLSQLGSARYKNVEKLVGERYIDSSIDTALQTITQPLSSQRRPHWHLLKVRHLLKKLHNNRIISWNTFPNQHPHPSIGCRRILHCCQCPRQASHSL